MSKAKITSHIGAGRYKVELYNDLTKINAKKTKLEADIVKNNDKITAKEAKKVTAIDKRDNAFIEYQSKMETYNQCLLDKNIDQCKREAYELSQSNKTYLDSQFKLDYVDQSLDSLYVFKRRLNDSLALYNNLPPEWEPIEVWSADLADDEEYPAIANGSIVSLIDIYSFDKRKYERWISPSTYGRNPSYDNSFGVNKPSLSSSPTGFIFNMNMLGPQLSWSPQYRLATINAIDEDTETATLSYFQLKDLDGVNYNGNEPTTGIKFDYMQYGYNSFSVGDAVIVSFCHEKFDSPLIIGFYSNPKGEKVFKIGYNLCSGTNYFNQKLLDDLDETLPSTSVINRNKSGITNIGDHCISRFSENHFVNIHIKNKDSYGFDTSFNYNNTSCTPDPSIPIESADTYISVIELDGVLTNAVTTSTLSGSWANETATIIGGFFLKEIDEYIILVAYEFILTRYDIKITKLEYNFSTSTWSRLYSVTRDDINEFDKPFLPFQLTDMIGSLIADGNFITHKSGEKGVFCYNDTRYSTTLKYRDNGSALDLIRTRVQDPPIGTPNIFLYRGIWYDDIKDNEILLEQYHYEYLDDINTELRSEWKIDGDILPKSQTKWGDWPNTHIEIPMAIFYNLPSKVCTFVEETIGYDESEDPEVTQRKYHLVCDQSVLNTSTSSLKEFTHGFYDYIFSAGQAVTLKGNHAVNVMLNDNSFGTVLNGELISILSDFNVFNVISSIIPPKKITNIKLTSNNANTSYAKLGDIITITFTQTYEIETLTLNIAGQSITPNKQGDNYTANYTVTGATPEIPIQFSIIADDDEFTDTSGIGRCSRVMVDLTKPTTTITHEHKNPRPIYNSLGEIEGYIYDLHVAIKISESTNELLITDLSITDGKLLRFYNDRGTYRCKIKTQTLDGTVYLQINQGKLKDKAGNENLLITYEATV